MRASAPMRWAIFWVIVAALILVPFFLFSKQIDGWTARFVASSETHRGIATLVLGALLAGDILLPVPSSIVSMSAGYLLGFAGGAATSFAGMTVSCALGYLLGKGGGRPLVNRLVGAVETARFDELCRRFGRWVLVACRPVPVLAEASVLLAGVARMPFRRFFLMTSLSNLGISAVYAGVGHMSAQKGAFLLAFAASVLLPGAAMLLSRRRKPCFAKAAQGKPG